MDEAVGRDREAGNPNVNVIACQDDRSAEVFFMRKGDRRENPAQKPATEFQVLGA